MDLDKLSLAIVEVLQQDGRRSFRDIARSLNISEGTVRKRVQSLRKKETIRIAAVPDPQKLGYDTICFIGFEIQLSNIEEISKKIAELPNVYYLSIVTGHYDLIAIVIFRSPLELSTFLKQHIAKIPGIIRVETFVNTEIVKQPWVSDFTISLLSEPGRIARSNRNSNE